MTDVGADGLQAGAPGDSANVAGSIVLFTDAPTAEHTEADGSYARMLRAPDRGSALIVLSNPEMSLKRRHVNRGDGGRISGPKQGSWRGLR